MRQREMRERGLSGRARGLSVALGAALTVGLVSACASQGIPSGGPPDRVPPVVSATRPDTFAVVEEVDGAVRIEFSERISRQPERGLLDDAVLVSPLLGEVEVDHERDALEIEMEGGFRPGGVYRITVLPVIRDMFGNVLQESFELVFSTGGEFNRNAVAGLIIDRVTGEAVDGATVMARPFDVTEDTLRYVSRTDTTGIYALRFLPTGGYFVQAFQDQDRDWEADDFEIQGEERTVVGPSDTLRTDVIVLTPDTTGPRLAQVSAEDSMTLRLAFDDYLDPVDSLGSVNLSLRRAPDSLAPDVGLSPDRAAEPDSAAAAPDSVVAVPDTGAPEVIPGVRGLMHAREWQVFRDSLERVAEEADTAEAQDTTAVALPDTLGPQSPDTGAVADTAGPDPRRAGEERRRGREEDEQDERQPEEMNLLPPNLPLPARELFVVLDGPLPTNVAVLVRVEGVVNLHGLVGGGRPGVVVWEPPEEPPEEPAAEPDSAGVAPPDTSQVPDSAAPPDTTGQPPDTTVAPGTTSQSPDTTAAPPDTTVAPDTTTAPPDTTVVPRGSPRRSDGRAARDGAP